MSYWHDKMNTSYITITPLLPINMNILFDTVHSVSYYFEHKDIIPGFSVQIFSTWMISLTYGDADCLGQIRLSLPVFFWFTFELD